MLTINPINCQKTGYSVPFSGSWLSSKAINSMENLLSNRSTNEGIQALEHLAKYCADPSHVIPEESANLLIAKKLIKRNPNGSISVKLGVRPAVKQRCSQENNSFIFKHS